jgi:hypothetical protein
VDAVLVEKREGVMRIKAVQKVSYGVVWNGDPLCHEELMWYATGDDRVLGVLIRDKIDDDYTWVVLTRRAGETWRAVELEVSKVTVDEARSGLHAMMAQIAGTVPLPYAE